MATRTVVVGSSMAGLLAARVLSEHADEVVVVERDDLLDESSPRRGVPQGRHAHAILASGERLIANWFPGILDDLVRRGAVRGDNGDARWYQAGAFRIECDTGIQATMASRPLLEGAVRRHLRARSNVVVRSGVHVDSLLIDGKRVTGVVLDGGEREVADLVVDCSGRSTRFPTMLADMGFPSPAMSDVKINMSYATRILRRRSDDLKQAYMIIAPTPPYENRFGVLLAMEDDRWILTVGGFHGDDCPTDDDGFRAYVRSLPVPDLAEVYERADVLSPVMTHRLPSNQRRHVEKVKNPPPGYLMLGDAICSFNPIYGQGMSSAAQQAAALGAVLRSSSSLAAPALPKAFYRKAAKVVNNPWQIAVGADSCHPLTTGPVPPMSGLVGRYVAQVQRATHVSPEVLIEMVNVQNLLAPPPSLMKPSTMFKVLRAARKSPAQPVMPVGGPSKKAPAPNPG